MEMAEPIEPRQNRLGELSLILGIFGFSIFFIAILPLGIFAAWFWSGTQLSGASSQPDHQWVEFFHQLLWLAVHRLWYLFAIPAVLVWYGLHSRRKTQT